MTTPNTLGPVPTAEAMPVVAATGATFVVLPNAGAVFTVTPNAGAVFTTQTFLDVGANLLPSAVRAASTVTGVITLLPPYSGLVFRLNVTANPGGGQTLSLILRTLMPLAPTTHQIVNFGVLSTALNGAFVAIIAPGITIADFNGGAVIAGAVKNARVPVQSTLQVVHSGAGNWTYQLDYQPLT